MSQAARHYDTDPPRSPRLSSDEQRIADAVVAALQSELKPIKDTQEQHTELLEQHTKILQQHTELLEQHTKILQQHTELLEQHAELLGQHAKTLQQHTKILENIQQEMRGVNRILASEGFIPDNPDL